MSQSTKKRKIDDVGDKEDSTIKEGKSMKVEVPEGDSSTTQQTPANKTTTTQETIAQQQTTTTTTTTTTSGNNDAKEAPVEKSIAEEEANAENEEIEEKAEKDDKLPLVLSVDDDSTNQKVITKLLSESYNVVTAMSGPEALRIPMTSSHNFTYTQLNFDLNRNFRHPTA